jgi:hypothetical protein
MTCSRLVTALAGVSLGLLLAACGSSSPSAPAPTFTALPYGATDFAMGSARVISPDGRTIGGASLVSQAEVAPVLWVGGRIQVLPFIHDPVVDFVRIATVSGLSNTGVVIGFEGFPGLEPIASYYVDGTWTAIVNPADDTQALSAQGISTDGNVIVGLIDGGGSTAESPNRGGFHLDRSAGTFAIIPSSFILDRECDSDKACFTQFFAVTGDGARAVGSDTYAPLGVDGAVEVPMVYRIRGGHPPLRLPLPYNLSNGRVLRSSSDGTTFVGMAWGFDMPTMAVVWDESYRVSVLGSLPLVGNGPPSSSALAASSGGGRIVGTSNGQAFLWQESTGMVSLQDWLVSQGLGTQLQDWDLWVATDISADGHWVVGTGAASGGYTTGFQVYLP